MPRRKRRGRARRNTVPDHGDCEKGVGRPAPFFNDRRVASGSGLTNRKYGMADFWGIIRHPVGKPRSSFPDTCRVVGKLIVRANYLTFFERSSRPPGNGRLDLGRDWRVSATGGACGSLGGQSRTSRVVRAGAGARVHSPLKSLPYSLDQTKYLRPHNSILPMILPHQGKREDALSKRRLEQ